MNVLIFGAGYSGQAFGRLCEGDVPVSGTTRSRDKFGKLEGANIRPLLWDGEARDEKVLDALQAVSHLVISAAPGEAGDPVLRAFRDDILAAPNLRWIGYLSTVGVYGDHDGAWVDETTPTAPRSRRSVERVEAEQAWEALAEQKNVPLATLRLSGIYGPGRNAFLNLESGTAKRLVKPGQVFNRIHGEDIGAALWHLAKADSGGIFNVTDDEPAPPQDVVTYAAGLMGVEPPPSIDFATADLSPMARSFYGENKRVSNAKLKATGFRFRFPDYRTALDAMWRDGNWRDGAGRSPISQS
jgi:nucleoside-diphosphate-sugar epimerase